MCGIVPAKVFMASLSSDLFLAALASVFLATLIRGEVKRFFGCLYLALFVFLISPIPIFLTLFLCAFFYVQRRSLSIKMTFYHMQWNLLILLFSNLVLFEALKNLKPTLS